MTLYSALRSGVRASFGYRPRDYDMAGILTLGALGASLSVDAFAASLGKGATEQGNRWRDAVRVGAVFGFFEAITPAIGYFLGYMLNDRIVAYDHWVAFGLLLAVGAYMVREALMGTDEPATEPRTDITYWRLAVTAIATSIDAAAVGISLALMDVNVWMACLIIGGITTIVATSGVMLGKHIAPHLGRYAGVLGGLVLVAIGGSILFQHLTA
nr:manganese efflux pump MntP family protein [Croceibacterium mercuriale]